MAKTLKFANAVLCEYVAKGAGNKHTLVNVYSGDVIASEIPANLVFGIYLEYLPEPDEVPSMGIEVKLGDDVLATLPVKVLPTQEGKPLNLVLQSIGINVQADTVFEVIATAEGRRRTVVLSKRIYKGNIQKLA